jgi:endonuclease YncB( thermonuclease family)
VKSHLFLVLAFAAAPAAGAISGPATVTDGDSVEIGGQRIRLFGIDAPEATQTCDRAGVSWACGSAAADQLRGLIGDATLSCDGNELDDFGRLLAVCHVNGADLNKTLVAQGWATAFRKYSSAYVADEERARAGRLGLWSSTFVPPEQYRAAEQAAAAPTARTPRVQSVAPPSYGSCLIKGNHSRRGEWIYHLPGMPYYAQTRAEEMFCSEAEAVAAGYRKSRAR